MDICIWVLRVDLIAEEVIGQCQFVFFCFFVRNTDESKMLGENSYTECLIFFLTKYIEHLFKHHHPQALIVLFTNYIWVCFTLIWFSLFLVWSTDWYRSSNLKNVNLPFLPLPFFIKLLREHPWNWATIIINEFTNLEFIHQIQWVNKLDWLWSES